MASIVQGYEYDIFISYRHNDNLSGWVTEFVSALRNELLATIKDPVSTYFDTNPHDGLLEIHDVDKSLENKLKCLIFLPIISQTYCDTKSYAWQHELIAFNILAKNDQFGLDVKLSNGNVTSRILAIKIHDLDQQDELLLENELGGKFRAINFFYQTSGINRPLTSRDDEVRIRDKTLYSDQINKTANAIQEIIRGIKNKEMSETDVTVAESFPDQSRKPSFRKKLIERNVLKACVVYLLVSLILGKASVLFSGMLHYSESFTKLLTLVLIIIFPFAVLMAWQYDRSPKGFIRTDSSDATKNPFTDEQKKPFTGNTFIALLLLTTAALFIFSPQIRSKEFTDNFSDVEKSIAVLPFFNDSPDQENSYYINGIMFEVLNNLQKIKEFRVLSRTSTEQYKYLDKLSISKIAKDLNVNYIVVGSGQKYNNKIVLRVQLISAHGERPVWSDSYKQDITETSDIISIQSEIAQLIASALKATITPEEKQLIEKSPTTNLTAYDFYERGEEEFGNYDRFNSPSRESVERAEKLYNKALTYDSLFALAYVGLAKVYAYKHYAGEYFSVNFLDTTIILVNKALSIDNRLAEAHFIKAIYYWEIGKINNVLKELDIALKLNPNYWEVYEFKGEYIYTWNYHQQDYIKAIENLQIAVSHNHGKDLPRLLRKLGSVYGDFAGFHDKANYYYEQAFKLDNDSALYYKHLAGEEANLEIPNKTVLYYKKCLAIDSANIDYYKGMGDAYMHLKNMKESLRYYVKYANWLKTTKSVSNGSSHRIGYAYWMNGYKTESDYWFNEQKKYCDATIKNKREYASIGLGAYYDLACLYSFWGDKKKAYENLKKVEQISVFPKWWVTLIKEDPLLNSLRTEKEFQKILNNLEAKYNAEHLRVSKWLDEQGNYAN